MYAFNSRNHASKRLPNHTKVSFGDMLLLVNTTGKPEKKMTVHWELVYGQLSTCQHSAGIGKWGTLFHGRAMVSDTMAFGCSGSFIAVLYPCGDHAFNDWLFVNVTMLSPCQLWVEMGSWENTFTLEYMTAKQQTCVLVTVLLWLP